MKKNAFKSYNIGSLPTGCKQCVTGHKSVIFITGRCPRKCFYCPVSEQKMYKDVIYCNERKIDTTDFLNQIVDEIRISKSTGASFTGGDPFCELKRTCQTIQRLKKEFGKEFHLHLYTSLNLITEKTVPQLLDSGLDELRVHPDLYDKKLWERIRIASNVCRTYKKKIGIEVPVIPQQEHMLDELITFVKTEKLVDYVNLNELEASCTNAKEFVSRGLGVKQLSSYAIVGSQECGLRLVKKFATTQFPIHYCTCKLKDAVQLSNRLKRRAKSIKQPHEIITTEGTLFFGEVQFSQNEDSSSIMQTIAKKYKIPQRLYKIEPTKIIIASWVLLELVDEFPGRKLLVTQYPTADAMRVQEEEIFSKVNTNQTQRIIGMSK